MQNPMPRRKLFRENPIHYLKSEGYSDIREINGKFYGIMRMMYTTGLFCDLDYMGPNGGRICFGTIFDARYWLASWDGITQPSVTKDGMAADKRSDKEKGFEQAQQ